MRLVKRIGDASVYAPRQALKVCAQPRGLAVVCPIRCAMRSER
jgi:hypothetical protein